MSNKSRIKEKLHHLRPLQWVIIALSVFLVINISIFISLLSDDISSYYPTESSMLYSVQSESFIRLRTQIGYYTKEEIAKSETLTECYHVALYFENSVFYNACLATGNEQLDAYQALCEENKTGTGTLSYNIALIDALFQ